VIVDEHLLSLLIKIEDAEKSGRVYFYKREDSDDPHADVSGLKELQRKGYISCGKFIPDMEKGGGHYAIAGPCRLEYSARQVLREVHSKIQIGEIERTKGQLQDAYEQALDHLSQATKHLRSLGSERARKDAVRDCLSAMESLLKAVTGSTDIKDATEKLKEQKLCPDLLSRDGLSIWNHIHNLYPDVRHGQPDAANLDEAEALYWVDRINAFIRLVAAKKRGA
jgi:hypothetical protein